MQNLAQKYRPHELSEVVGQDVIVNIIDNICSAHELTHRNFLFIGFAGCGKTTLAKIIARRLNEGSANIDGNIIEIDAASNSGVDAMRNIVNQARSYPVGANYKVFVIDECVSGETEILTDKGFKRIDSLDRTEKIAQYTQSGDIEFVVPEEYIDRPYQGTAYRMYCSNGKKSVLMTPHHVQPQLDNTSGKIVEEYISEAKFGSDRKLIVSGKGTGDNRPLDALDKLAIAVQANGYREPTLSKDGTYRWQMRLKQSSKIEYLEQLFDEASIHYTKSQRRDSTECDYFFNLPCQVSNQFSSTFSIDMGYDRARQFTSEILKWSENIRSEYPGCYSSTCEENVRFVSAILAQCNCAATQELECEETEEHNALYSVNWCYTTNSLSSSCSVKEEQFDGRVYCVKVPSHMIILRAEGFTFVSGNCHALSPAAWQAALLTIESQPAKSVFCWCTTNPEKIPATILSRVQTFQLSKISLDKVIGRLKYIIENENKEGRNITYEEDAVAYIAKLANGGMRDAITNMDQCLSFSSDLTMSNVQKALGLPEYSNYFELLNAIAKKDNAKIVAIINTVYNSGVNFTKWFDEFFSFVTNIVKYIYLQDINQTMIPAIYQDKISGYGPSHSALCLKLSNKLAKMNQELKTTPYLQELAISYLCTPPSIKK